MDLMYILTWIVTISGLIQAVLIFKKMKENMYLQLIFSSSFLLMSYNLKLYADIFESAILLILAGLGTYIWTKKEVVNISYSKKQNYIISLIIFIISNIIMIPLLQQTDDPYPILDSITTSLSLIGAYLMAVKKIEAWICWFMYDIISIVIYISLGSFLWNVVILNIIWTMLAVGTYISWNKEIKIEINI